MTKIFVGGFPLDITELELVQLISWHGTVDTIKIVRDKKTRICKGYAFVEMTDREGAENAVINLNGTMLQGRELTLNITEDQPVKKVPASRPYNKPSQYSSSPKPSNFEAGQKPKRPRKITN